MIVAIASLAFTALAGQAMFVCMILALRRERKRRKLVQLKGAPP